MALDSFNGQVNDKLTSARWKKNPPLLHTLHASHSPAPGQVAKRDAGEPPGRSVASGVGRRMQTQQESETPENIGTPKKQIPPPQVSYQATRIRGKWHFLHNHASANMCRH